MSMPPISGCLLVKLTTMLMFSSLLFLECQSWTRHDLCTHDGFSAAWFEVCIRSIPDDVAANIVTKVEPATAAPTTVEDVELTTSSVNNVRHDSLRDVAALRRFILRLILFILQNEEKDISYNASDEIIMKALLLSTTKYQNKDKAVNSVVPEAEERHLTDQKVDVRPREVHDIHGPFASEFEAKDGLMGYNEEVQDYGADVRKRIPDSVRPYDKETDSRKREDVRSALELEDGAGRDDLVRTAAGVFLRRRAKPLGRSRRWRRNPQDWARMMALNTKCCNLGCVKAEVQATCR